MDNPARFQDVLEMMVPVRDLILSRNENGYTLSVDTPPEVALDILDGPGIVPGNLLGPR